MKKLLVMLIFMVGCHKQPQAPTAMKATRAAATPVTPINTGIALANNGPCSVPATGTFAGVQICNDNGTLVVYNTVTGESAPFPFHQLKTWMTCQGTGNTGDTVAAGFQTSCQFSVKSIN